MNRFASAFALSWAFALPAMAQPFTVVGGKNDAENVVVTWKRDQIPEGRLAVVAADGTTYAAQAAAPSLLEGDRTGKDVVFVLPKLKGGAEEKFELVTRDGKIRLPKFQFREGKDGTDLLFEAKTVMRYVNAPHDPKHHYLTFKVFHHVFDPAKGETVLTNGAHEVPDGKLFLHHRGLFYGWNKVTYGDNVNVDIWHGKDAFQQHEKVLLTEEGEVLGRQRTLISWNGKDGKPFAEETREVTAYKSPQRAPGTLIDFASVLTPKAGTIKLDGDPQHAGFHFRAATEVAKSTAKQTYYLRPDGKDKPGATRNWPAQKDHINLPWNAMSFVLGGQRYTVLYMDRPDNPKEARFSERDYGRFGNYFATEVTPEKPLKVKYRVWVQEGEMTVEQCEAMSRGFLNPPEVK